MSNTQVGAVYQQIIADVVEASRVDFEEDGVDDSVLEELRQVWQRKLSQLNVATFPWDPKPEPQTLMHPPTIPSNGSSFPMPGASPQPALAQLPNGPRIKPEPGLDPNFAAIPNLPMSLPGPSLAQQRALQNVQGYINQAQENVQQQQNLQAGRVVPLPQDPQQAIQQHMLQQQQQQQQHQLNEASPQQRAAQPAQGSPPARPAMPSSAQRPSLSQAEYNRAMAQNAQQAAENIKRNSLSGPQAQTDGAGDDDDSCYGVAKQYDASGVQVGMGRVEIDHMIRQRIESIGRSMEGGGLMVPLAQASTARSRRAARPDILPSKGADRIGGQHDGLDDDGDLIKDEDLDEDAINSDLDDPDELGGGEEDDDEASGHIMLCMYDKVQRVKNKWKCVLKDGVLTVNEKEYVFHKATGEYEW